MPLVKVIEIKDADWIKGLSLSPNIPFGGLFQQLYNCDPFAVPGAAVPSTVPALQATGTVTPKFLQTYNNVGANFVLAHSDTKLYHVSAGNASVDDTAQINQNLGGASVAGILNTIIWRGQYVYSEAITDFANPTHNVQVSANSIPVLKANDVSLYQGTMPLGSGQDFLPMCVGPSGYLYVAAGSTIYVFTNVAGTSGNAANNGGNGYQTFAGYTIRDLSFDGVNLVIAMDSNLPGNTVRLSGTYSCRIGYWDGNATVSNGGAIDFATTWDIPDQWLISVRQSDLLDPFAGDANYVIGHAGIYVCSKSSAPRLIRPFGSVPQPLNPAQVTGKNGSIYWCDGYSTTSKQNVYAYGNPISGEQKIFYQPYGLLATGFSNTCIAAAGNQLALGLSGANGVAFFNAVSGSLLPLTLMTLDETPEQPMRYEFTKVVLLKALTAGQTVTVSAYSQDGSQLISQETKSFNVANPKQGFKFTRIPTGTNQPEKYNDLTVVVGTTGGASLQRVSVYATPLDDANEEF